MYPGNLSFPSIASFISFLSFALLRDARFAGSQLPSPLEDEDPTL